MPQLSSIDEIIEALQALKCVPEKLEGTEKLWDVFAKLALVEADPSVTVKIDKGWSKGIDVTFTIHAGKIYASGPTLQKAWEEYMQKKNPPPDPSQDDQIKNAEAALGIEGKAGELPVEVLEGAGKNK